MHGVLDVAMIYSNSFNRDLGVIIHHLGATWMKQSIVIPFHYCCIQALALYLKGLKARQTHKDKTNPEVNWDSLTEAGPEPQWADDIVEDCTGSTILVSELWNPCIVGLLDTSLTVLNNVGGMWNNLQEHLKLTVLPLLVEFMAVLELVFGIFYYILLCMYYYVVFMSYLSLLCLQMFFVAFLASSLLYVK